MVALPLLAVLKDGGWTIRLAQESSGRYVSTRIKSDVDRVDAVRWWLPRVPATERVAFHPGITPVHWSLGWEMRPHVLTRNQPVGGPGTSPRFYTLDSRFADAGELRQAAQSFHVDAVGCFWFVDRAAPATPLSGFSFDERDPSPVEWYLSSGTEPVRTVRPDWWVTWEWRSLLGQPADAPTAEPTTAEQERVAHNVALAQEDSAAAARRRGELARLLDVRRTARFDDGTELLGVIRGRGAEHAMTLYFLAGPNGLPPNVTFSVSAQVIRAPSLSTLPLDPEVIEVGLPPTVPTKLWRPGHIYSIKFTYRHRPGTERLFGTFVASPGGRAPALIGGARSVELAIL